MSREDWEAEQTRLELERLRITKAREEEEARLAKEYKDDAELKRAKRELDELKRREAAIEEEKRIAEEIELKRLKKEREKAAEEERREREAAEAVKRYKQAEQERITKEAKEKERNEKEYKRRLQEDLINSGLDEKAIAAIINKEKLPKEPSPPPPPAPLPLPHHHLPQQQQMVPAGRPTYTRMARKHLSIETLREYRVEFDFDNDPDFVLIKRWVPEWEQDQFWKHTKYVRERRTLVVEDRHHHHHHHGKDLVFVRDKSKSRRRSKSPGLLMYLAGGRPS
jgi:hypothetical protein